MPIIELWDWSQNSIICDWDWSRLQICTSGTSPRGRSGLQIISWVFSSNFFLFFPEPSLTNATTYIWRGSAFIENLKSSLNFALELLARSTDSSSWLLTGHRNSAETRDQSDHLRLSPPAVLSAWGACYSAILFVLITGTKAFFSSLHVFVILFNIEERQPGTIYLIIYLMSLHFLGLLSITCHSWHKHNIKWLQYS